MNTLIEALKAIKTEAFLQTMIGLGGTLLGLSFAAFIFVLQDGFQSFKESRTFLLKLYVGSGKKIIYALSYVLSISIVRLYFTDNSIVMFVFHLFFCFVFIKSILDYASYQGYIVTLNSSKYIPKSYGPFYSYFRKIKNLGIFRNVLILLQILLFCISPVLLTYYMIGRIEINNESLLLSITLFLLFAIIYLASFIPNFFNLSIKTYEMSVTGENPTFDATTDIVIDYQKEKTILKKYLQSRQYLLNKGTDGSILGKDVQINYLEDDKPEAWFNINIDNPNGDPVSLRREIEKYAVSLFSNLRESECDINSFVESFHLFYSDKHRNIFFRVTRAELNELRVYETSPVDYIAMLKSKLFDDLFRDM